MPPSRDPFVAALERQHHNDRAEIQALRVDLNEQRTMTRGYRRLFIEALRRSRDCPTCNPPKTD